MKFNIIIIVALCGTIAFNSSCTSDVKKQAEARLNQAQEMYDNKDYEQSIRVLDSIQSWFPEEYAVLSKAIELKHTVAKEYHEGFINQAAQLLEPMVLS